MTTDRSSSPLQPVLTWSGLLSPILFWGGVAVLGSLFPGYSHIRDTVSELGAFGTPTSAWQNINFIINGALVTAFAVGLHRALPDGSQWGPLLLAIFGLVGLIGSGLLPCDPGCLGTTRSDQLHFIPSSIGFPSLLAGLFITYGRMSQGAWKDFAGYTRITAWFGLVSFMTLNFVFIGLLPGLIGFEGLLQRIFIGSVFLWIFLTSLRMLRQSS